MTKRHFGLDLCRVLAAFGIVILHILGGGGGLSLLKEAQVGYWTGWGLETLAFISVNLFGLLSGYLMCEKKQFKSNRLVELLVTYVLYMVCITTLFAIFSPSSFGGKRGFIKSFFPMLFGASWYTTCYVAVFLISPYINLLLNKLTDKELLRFSALLFVLFSLLSGNGKVDYFVVSKGYSVLWLVVLYIFGATIKRAYKQKSFTFKIIGASICFFLLLLERLGFYVIRGYGNSYLLNYNSPVVTIMAIFVFMIFIDIKTKGTKSEKIIGILSASAFDVYILHTQTVVYNALLKGKFAWLSELNGFLVIFVVLLISAVICLLCLTIGTLKNRLLKTKPFVTLVSLISEKLDSLWVKRFEYNESK